MDVNMAVTIEGIEVNGNLASKVAFFWDRMLLIASPTCKRSNRQLASGKELFNYRHSSLRLVIKRCFGVLKAHFPILSCMANYKQSHERLVVSACCALRNFIRINNHRYETFNTWENLNIHRDDVQAGNNENSHESSASAKRRYLREMSDAAKREMGEFKDDVTACIWEEFV
nr:hypothetical protein CFP56_16142 [Quercus suber]